MEKEFIPYELALKLKELGFDGECLAFSYVKSEYGFTANEVYLVDYLDEDNLIKNSNKEYYYARPLWQQAFDWFREKYNLCGEISYQYDDKYYVFIKEYIYERNNPKPFTYEEARQACLEKVIEIVENENRTH